MPSRNFINEYSSYYLASEDEALYIIQQEELQFQLRNEYELSDETIDELSDLPYLTS